jgi:hypothetical protein
VWTGLLALGTYTSSTFTESTSANYARQPITFGSSHQGHVQGSGAVISFPVTTSALTTYNAYGLFPGLTGGSASFIYPLIANVVQQIFVTFDKSRLLVGVQLGRRRFRLAVLHVQPMQQRDQPRPALIGDAAFGLDPGANLAGCSRRRRGDPGFQPGLLRLAQAAGTAVMTKTCQAFDALVRIPPMPSADGVVVQQKDFRDASSSSTSALARRASR